MVAVVLAVMGAVMHGGIWDQQKQAEADFPLPLCFLCDDEDGESEWWCPLLCGIGGGSAARHDDEGTVAAVSVPEQPPGRFASLRQFFIPRPFYVTVGR